MFNNPVWGQTQLRSEEPPNPQKKKTLMQRVLIWTDAEPREFCVLWAPLSHSVVWWPEFPGWILLDAAPGICVWMIDLPTSGCFSTSLSCFVSVVVRKGQDFLECFASLHLVLRNYAECLLWAASTAQVGSAIDGSGWLTLRVTHF